MSDLSDNEKSPRRDIVSSKGKKVGDGSGRSVDIPPVYHLTSSDNTGAQVIACIFNGDNYMTWSRAMLIALRARNKLPLIDGSLEKPREGDPLRDRWERCNSMLLAWIFNTMEERLQAIVAYAIDAKSLWNDLKERYSEVSSRCRLNKVYNLVANEERQRIVTQGRDSVYEAAVFLAKNEADEHNAGRALMETMNSAGRAVQDSCGKRAWTRAIEAVRWAWTGANETFSWAARKGPISARPRLGEYGPNRTAKQITGRPIGGPS
ncbi:hypothetical protein CRG98_040956 [Punica granatum]|uniref:Retrotransposon Copia-like N-terminal domain-containing protein n=1 Tax=Punica granatum TaxID=22663 RepID=A0A2I0I4R1_PUNGR|nr:hypothetical protein CRG98_040956 [Punica granatum]